MTREAGNGMLHKIFNAFDGYVVLRFWSSCKKVPNGDAKECGHTRMVIHECGGWGGASLTKIRRRGKYERTV